MANPAFLSYNQRGMLARLRCLELEDWERIPDCGEGLAQRLYRAARQGTSLEDVYELAKTTRDAHARIRLTERRGAGGPGRKRMGGGGATYFSEGAVKRVRSRRPVVAS